MKIRNGFVSNSSSSSFVLFFENKPESREHLRKLLFGEDSTDDDFRNQYDYCYNLKQITERIYNDIQVPSHKDDILEELMYSLEDSIFSKILESDSDYIKQIKKDYVIFIKLTKKYSSKLWGNKTMDSSDKLYNTTYESYNYCYVECNRLKLIIAEYMNKAKFEKYKHISVVEYSDNDSSFDSFLEHSELFDNIESIRISKH